MTDARLITAEDDDVGDAPPRRWVLFLHGILGSGDNWRSFARRLVSARPDWGAALVDLHLHGSKADAEPPATIARCSDDLLALGDAIPGSIDVVCGHSFGGKVALDYASRREPIAHLWVFDSDPGPRSRGASGVERAGRGDAARVLDVLETMPEESASRFDFTRGLEERGLSRGVAGWLAKNLVRTDDGYRFALRVPCIRKLLADYGRRDLWPELETLATREPVDVVLGGRSRSLAAESRERLRRLGDDGVIGCHVLEDAGHWVHVDAPDALLRLVVEGLPA